MNPSRITPEIAEALMRRRAGGVGGGNTMPAQQQVMAPNPMGGPMGPSQTPLATSPQAVPSGNIAQPSSPPMPQQGGQPATGQASSTGTGGTDPNKVLMKALLQRLVSDL